MAQKLFDVLEWVRASGGADALLRLRLKVLPLSVREGIILDRVDATTKCSDAYLAAARKAASEVVGKVCPR